MARTQLRACFSIRIVVLSVVIAAPGFGADPPEPTAKRASLVLLESPESESLTPLRDVVARKHPRHRLYLELDGARAQAEDWLRQGGFALLEERDLDNRRSYQVVSNPTTDWPGVRLHARIGRPQLSAGLQPRRQIPALGISIPWERYEFQLEGLSDHRFGWALLWQLQWSDAQRRVQWGVALPLGISHGPSVGALFQLRLRFSE
jgi:hypothetical protein